MYKYILQELIYITVNIQYVYWRNIEIYISV